MLRGKDILVNSFGQTNTFKNQVSICLGPFLFLRLKRVPIRVAIVPEQKQWFARSVSFSAIYSIKVLSAYLVVDFVLFFSKNCGLILEGMILFRREEVIEGDSTR